MTSADKLGMVVAVAVVVIFVGIGVGMSGVPQETNRPGMEQQATMSRDVEVPKQIQIMPDSTNKIPSIEPNPSPAPIIDDDDIIGIAPLPSPYPRPDNPDYLREGYVLEFKKYQQQSSNIINLNPRTNSMEIIKSAIHESTDKDSDVSLDLSKLIVQAIENKRLGTIDLVKMDVGPVGLSGEMDAGHYCTILSNGVYVIKQSVDESGEKQFTLSTNGQVFAILKSVEGKTSVILAAFISGPIGDSEFGGNIIGNAPLAGNLRDYVGWDVGPIGLIPDPTVTLRLPGDAVIVVDIAEKPEIVVGNNLIINLSENNIAIDGSESYIGSSEMSRPGMEQQAMPRDPSIPKEPPVISRDVQIEREVIPEARDATSEPMERSIAPEGYEFEPKEASCDKVVSVSLDNLSISFDKSSYQLNDVVQITVIAPSFNLSPYEIDCFGGGTTDHTINFTIGPINPSQTNYDGHDLYSYKLIETGRDTGVFTGSFTISGYNSGDNYGLNSVANYGDNLGPDDGSVKHGDCLSNELNENGSGFSYYLKYSDWVLYSTVWEEGLWDERINTTAEINCFIELDEYNSTIFTQTIGMNVGSNNPECAISDTCFMPSKITINVGDSLAWMNYDSTPHTVTSGSASEGPNDYFDSGLKKELESYILKFNSPGEFDYYSMIDPWMTGTVIVE